MASNRFHISVRGESATCDAPPGKCPLNSEHFDTAAEAAQYVENSMAEHAHAGVTKKPRETESVEVYRHPQGKVATIRNGSLEVTKDGKVTKSSATIDKLRAGHGRWTKDVDASDEGSARTTSPAESSTGGRELTQREKAIISNQYPVDTKLDPSNPLPLADRPAETEYIRSSVLPTQTRINPHTAGEGNEYVEIWSKGDDSTRYLVVKGESRGKETHRIIAGWKANEDTALGDTFPLEHDQTCNQIGDSSWEVIGAFEAKDGGQSTGTIPNKKIPLYTYK